MISTVQYIHVQCTGCHVLYPKRLDVNQRRAQHKASSILQICKMLEDFKILKEENIVKEDTQKLFWASSKIYCTRQL